MAKEDWTLMDTVKPDDFNDIGREINQLRSDVDNIEIPPASLTTPGIVQLSNSTNSSSETLAATPKAVKSAYDAATAAQNTANAANEAAAQAFQLGNERKAEVVAALVALGVSASTSESWDSLIGKMAAIIKATGNATAADLLAGKTASNVNGPITGTMPNRGAGGTVTPGTSNQTKDAGYYSSPITILGDGDLVPGNIRSGINVFGVAGTVVEEHVMSPGSYRLYGSDSKSSRGLPAGSPIKVTSVTVGKSGKYRIQYRFSAWQSSDHSIYVQVYKNGIPYGPEKSTNSLGGTTFTDDLEFLAGDTIEIWSRNQGYFHGPIDIYGDAPPYIIV